MKLISDVLIRPIFSLVRQALEQHFCTMIDLIFEFGRLICTSLLRWEDALNNVCMSAVYVISLFILGLDLDKL